MVSTTTITNLPRILILFFKRFQFVRGKFSKNDVLVEFPVNILDADEVFKSAANVSCD